MTDAHYRVLENRAVLRLEGADRKTFLQGIVSNDVSAVSNRSAVWTALLTPQGKFLHEFFLVEQGDSLLLEGEAERLDDLKKRLTLYKLRSKVTLAETPDLAVVALFGEGVFPAAGLQGSVGEAREDLSGMLFVDPRLADLGVRALLPREGLDSRLKSLGITAEAEGSYERLRIGLGIPDGSRDLEVEKSTLMEAGFDELGAIDWKKGCFVGQELTARMRYRGLAKRRLVPVDFQGTQPEMGAEITLKGKPVGQLRSQDAKGAIALLRLEALGPNKVAEDDLVAGETTITPRIPSWFKLPASEEQP